jgi:hypothetical protein
MQDRANPYSRERTIAISSQTTGVSPNEVVVAGADVLDPMGDIRKGCPPPD